MAMVLTVGLAGCHNIGAMPAPVEPRAPNIVLIVADDLGYSDLGAYGSEIPTPNLDALAETGVQLTNFYVAPTCSPTRAMLLTGLDNHQAGFGTMTELVQPDQSGRAGYEGYLPLAVPTIAERLHALGYATLMSGKWHLGDAIEHGPAARGFDHSFVLVQGAHNHFGADLTPQFAQYDASPTYRLDGAAASWPKGGYSSQVFTDRMLGFMQQAEAETKPFFAYLSYTAPHWPLQAPKIAIDRHAGVYDVGPEAIAEARIQRMASRGLIDASAPRNEEPGWSGWNKLSPASRQREAKKMEVYAAMVEELDRNVGRIVDSLRKSGQLDNTIFIFLSDNGPDRTLFEFPINPKLPGKPLPVATDNSTANLGSATSYFSYGPVWARVGASPFSGFKGSVSEGGIRAPAIFAGPGIGPGSRERTTIHVRDIFPTIMGLAGGVAHPAIRGAGSEGINILPMLADPDEGPSLRSGHNFWELFYRAAIVEGHFKAVYQPNKLPILGETTRPGEVGWQLFDLTKDPFETSDIAQERSAQLARLKDLWFAEADRLGIVLLDEDTNRHSPKPDRKAGFNSTD